MASGDRGAHRPARFPDLTEILDQINDASGGPGAQAEIASATALAVVRAGRAPERDGSGAGAVSLIDLAERVGLDTLAELWRTADPVSLPGALWALYLLRQWCQADGDEVARLWRAGEPLAPVDAAVAGVADLADASALAAVSDAVLFGVFQGDLAVALDRAAGLFRVIAAGRRSVAGDADERRPELVELAEANERAARALTICATRWRSGTLH